MKGLVLRMDKLSDLVKHPNVTIIDVLIDINSSLKRIAKTLETMERRS